MELEPGPFWDREEMPLGPPVATEGLFERLLEPLVHALVGSDVPLGRLSDDVGRDVPDHIEAQYLTTAGAAEDEHFAHAMVPEDQTAPALVDAGAGSEMYRQSVLRYLPQPDSAIDVDFSDPPEPPGGFGQTGHDHGDTPQI